MSTEFIWQLPTAGDCRYGAAQFNRRGERQAGSPPPFTAGVSDPRGARFNFFDYLHQTARAVELAGFDGVQVQHDVEGDESWIVAGYVARSTSRLKVLTEFEAARGSAVYAAKNAISYQRFSGGRFAWQISAGGDAAARRRQGDFVADSDVAPRIEEFLTVARGVIAQAPFSFKGRFFEVLNGGLQGPLGNRPAPRVYLSGDSEADFSLSARSADVHVFAAAPAAAVATSIAALNERAAAQGRNVAAALRIDVLARATEQEAVRDAERYLQQTRSTRSVVDDGLWLNFAGPRTGARAVLIGSYAQVAERLAAYAAAGVSSFILAAQPHLEEAYRVGEHLLPLLRAHITEHSRVA